LRCAVRRGCDWPRGERGGRSGACCLALVIFGRRVLGGQQFAREIYEPAAQPSVCHASPRSEPVPDDDGAPTCDTAMLARSDPIRFGTARCRVGGGYSR
jgi:hypothetical protein